MATHPCKCGYLSDEGRACSRAPLCGADYQAKISGPLYDRMDLFVEVPAVSATDLTAPAMGESSAMISARVQAARERQAARFKKLEADGYARVNAHADGKLLEQIVTLDDAASDLMGRAADRYQLSARGYHRVLKVARTIADLAHSDAVTRDHLAEALSYRRIDARQTLRRVG